MRSEDVHVIQIKKSDFVVSELNVWKVIFLKQIRNVTK